MGDRKHISDTEGMDELQAIMREPETDALSREVVLDLLVRTGRENASPAQERETLRRTLTDEYVKLDALLGTIEQNWQESSPESGALARDAVTIAQRAAELNKHAEQNRLGEIEAKLHRLRGRVIKLFGLDWW